MAAGAEKGPAIPVVESFECAVFGALRVGSP